MKKHHLILAGCLALFVLAAFFFLKNILIGIIIGMGISGILVAAYHWMKKGQQS